MSIYELKKIEEFEKFAIKCTLQNNGINGRCGTR